MKITINKKEYELNFGVRFVNELDHVAGISQNGISLGFGLTKSLPALQSYDSAALANVLYSATVTIKVGRPSEKDIIDFLDDPANDLEPIFDEVNKEIAHSNATKVAAKKMRA